MTEIDYDLFITQLFAKAEKSGVPLGGTFELTSRCTLSCKMCYIHSGCSEKPEKSTAWWSRVCVLAKFLFKAQIIGNMESILPL